MKIYKQIIRFRLGIPIKLIWLVCLFFSVNDAEAQFFNKREIFSHQVLIYSNIMNIGEHTYITGIHIPKKIILANNHI
jgi:hypothetical protein